MKKVAYSATFVSLFSTMFSKRVDSAPIVGSASVDASTENFLLEVPPGWTILPRKLPSATFNKYLSEEILLVASNFVEGVSLSVTRSNAQRLLKDFNIDWWFDNLTTIQDVGNADLIARLLILQRQGNFDGKSPSSTSLVSSKLENQVVYFVFETPVVEGVNRISKAKTFFKNGFLYVLWISGLGSTFDSDYSVVVQSIQDSFTSKTS